MRSLLSVTMAVGLLALAGCGAAHLTVTHGKATTEYYRAQVVNPEAGAKSVAILGLDSTEAAIVAKNYYDSLVAEGGEAQQGEQILIVSPDKQSDQNLPPPSVPEGTR